MGRGRAKGSWAAGLVIASAFTLVDCQCAAPPAASHMPEGELEAWDVRVESVGNDRWTARATRASGSLQRLELTGVTWDLGASSEQSLPGQARWQLRAESGLLERGGLSWLEQVEAESNQGARLTSPKAKASPQRDRVELSGPVRWTQPGLEITATSGVLDLQGDTVTLEGPVRGRWSGAEPPSTAP